MKKHKSHPFGKRNLIQLILHLLDAFLIKTYIFLIEVQEKGPYYAYHIPIYVPSRFMFHVKKRK